ncbi:hypothetical protein HF669_13675 [Acidithiobacillus thiooxidans]|uniref:hypothetical protein n=1 Tax=Acidithiobacillus TaxID=119977 RepID=UPI00094B0CEF|nr:MULTISPECIES: hypothetical protein [Acidithiobacillus]MBU2812375.1 hypothetical protein [Acidithiobacillus thiooxidans]
MMEFHPHAVAYLDILGFSNFVKAAEEDPIKLKQLDILFYEIIPREISSEGRNSAFPDDMELKCLSCSDSLVISAPISEKSPYPPLVAISIKAIQIAHALLDMGFLVRGAIAVGNVHCTKSNIFGTGFQQAVEGEKTAVDPQIILNESAVQALDGLKGSIYGNLGIFAKNNSGQIILDSIYPEQHYLPNKNGDVEEYFKKYRQIIMNNLSHRNPEARRKWLWFSGLFNANVKYFTSHFGFLKDKPMVISNDELPDIVINYLNPPPADTTWLQELSPQPLYVKIKAPECSPKEEN